jgi:tetratricopeptide (TPR) repeat protein
MKDFFISYNKADRVWAEWIAWQLEESGRSVVIQAWDFRPGGNFVLDMQRAAEDCERIIAVLSPDYLTSRFTAPEWAAAFAKDPTGEKGLLLPVRVRECELRGLLSQAVYIDLVQADETKAKELLLAGIMRGRAKPDIEPRFPESIQRIAYQQLRFPGALPPIWNIPYQRNPNFTGREEDIAAMREALNAGAVAALAQAITGLGGIGKTQLAIEYAYRRSADYTVVWWVRAEEIATMTEDYAALAVRLDLPEKDDQKLPVVVEAVRRRLGQLDHWLLIFDDARGVADVRNYIPQSHLGHIIITSRDVRWGSTAHKIEVKVLPRQNSVEFLLRRTGQQDETSGMELAAELGDLPLALEQAGAYIEATGISLADYLRLFRTRRQELWGEEQPPPDYPDTIATTWLLSFREVKQSSQAAADLMNLSAFLAPDAIPQWLLHDQAAHLPPALAATVEDELAFVRAIADLRRFSLIEVDKVAHTYSIHRLVQAVTRDQLVTGHQKAFVKAAISILNAAFPQESEDARAWPVCSAIIQHVLTAINHSERLETRSLETARLVNQSGLYFLGRAETVLAKDAFEHALIMYEALLGPDHSDVATVISNLGRVKHELGDLTGALKHFERALIKNELAHGSEHPNVARDLGNLGAVRRDLNDSIGAQSCFEKALKINLKLFGPEHTNVAKDFNNLGMMFLENGDLTRAKPLLEQALAIDEALYGPTHPKVAIRINNLGGLLQSSGDLAGARERFEQALKIDQECYGKKHPNIAVRLNNLSGVLKQQGHLEAAYSYSSESLQIYESVFGTEHPAVADVLNDLGLLLKDLGDLEKAQGCCERALKIDEGIYGIENHKVARDINNLGLVLRAAGNLVDARAAFERALNMCHKFYGAYHPNTQLVQKNLLSLGS